MIPGSENSLVEHALSDSLLEYSSQTNGSTASVSGLFCFSESLEFFPGHFPGQPVFPAFLQFVLVRLLVERTLDLALDIIEIGKTKFSSIIRPGEEVRVLIDIRETADDINAKFKIYCSDNLASTGIIIYRIGK